MKQDKDEFGYTFSGYRRLLKKGAKYPHQLTKQEEIAFKYYAEQVLKKEDEKKLSIQSTLKNREDN